MIKCDIALKTPRKLIFKVNKIIAHNINVFINRQLIYNYPEQLFADAGIMAIEHADFEGIERLALVLGRILMAKGGLRGEEELDKRSTCLPLYGHDIRSL